MDAWYIDRLQDYTRRMQSYYDHVEQSIPFSVLWPIKGSVITQHFGARPEYYGKWFKTRDGRPLGHEGTDFAMPMRSLKKTLGQPVLAGAKGVIRLIDTTDDSNYGISVRLECRSGEYELIYAHLHSITVKPEDEIKRGQVIGYAGNTGNSTAPHLHLTVKQRGYDEEGYPIDMRGYGIMNPEPLLIKL